MVALALSLAACASKAPPYEQPRLPVAETYPAAARPSPEAAPAPAIGWREYFTDPRMQSLIELALSSNRDLRVAALRVEEARAAYRIQRADQWPLAAASATAARARVPDLGITGRPMDLELVAAGVGASSWELDFWGRIRSLKEAALETYLATDEARRATALSLVAQVANSYLALCELDERLALARRSAEVRAESLRIFRRRVALGATSALELTQVELLWHQATALVSELELARARQAHALEVLLGAPADLSTKPTRLDEVVFPDLAAGLPSELLARRPDILAAEHGLKSANASIGVARAALFPRISLTGLLGLASADLTGLFSTDSGAWVFTPSAALPIFDGGRRAAAQDVAELRREQAVVRYEQAIQAAFRDVSDALSTRQWLTEQVRTLGATLAVQTERARLAKLRYDSGAARYLEVLDAERELLAVQQQLVQTRRALLSSRVALYAALGGGTETSTPSKVTP